MVVVEYKNDCIHLHVPFEQKSRAQKLGAKWDAKSKTWYFAFDLKLWRAIEMEFGDELVVSPVFRMLLVRKRHAEEEFLEAKRIAERDDPVEFEVKGISLEGKNPFYNYQKHGVKCGLAVGDGFLIGDVMGLGKSIQALGLAVERRNNGDVSNCLIVCPASLKYNWLQEIHKFTKESVLVIDGAPADRAQKWIAAGYFFKVVNYETIAIDLFWDAKKKGVDRRIAGYQSILTGFDMIVVDEIQALKHGTSLRSKAMKQFRTKYRVGLSGTPIDGKLEELHSIFEFLKPGLFPSHAKFMERYAVTNYFKAVVGYKNVDEVKEKIEPYYLRRLKHVVLKDLPEKIYKDVFVELSNKEMKLYKDLIKKKNEVTSEAMAATVVLRARQFCDFPEILDMRNPSAKFAALDELLQELIGQNNEKVIIFTQYKQALDLIYKNLKSSYKILQIHGGVGSKERLDLVNEFNNDKSVNIILMTDAGCSGLNLQEAHHVIHYEDNFSPATMQQRNDRAHRATTKHTVTIWRFQVLGTIEEHVRKILDKKMQVTNKMLNESNTEFSVETLSNTQLIELL